MPKLGWSIMMQIIWVDDGKLYVVKYGSKGSPRLKCIEDRESWKITAN
jgi:hypothetical protein